MTDKHEIIALLNNPTVAISIAIIAWQLTMRLIIECAVTPGTQTWEAIGSGIAIVVALFFTRIYCKGNIEAIRGGSL